MAIKFAEVEGEISKINKKYGFLNTIIKNPKTASGKGPLAGVAISVKDNICVKDIQSTAGSKILEDYIPPFDATSIAKILDAGGTIIGKTNQDEFGFGTFCTNSGYNIPKNPHDPTRCCGGSSGGAAGLAAAWPTELEKKGIRHIIIPKDTGVMDK